ncbi:glycoside hydrolase 5 family protein [Kibdelosporangium aridum]|uniref:mannan endo-1,4-beta-mannosidase n=1 Tax=Kibdelosporangium aridum TaxID=2030 RepID=A0A1W2FFS7_KIBAR|nr:cellulase family glycosylhydrolase [Kibdelosporangium aridum]SMD20516.1 Cellulase (glycosyl hydrolase family 5) [Kibdelosporangium aridum]
MVSKSTESAELDRHTSGGSELVRRGRHFLCRDGRAFVPVGTHVVPRSGPDWAKRVGAAAFDEAFAQLASLGLDTARIDVLWEAVEPAPGQYDEAHLAVLDEVLAAARKHGVLLHPCLFVGGEVGDAYWDIPWRNGRNPHTDAELLRAQAAQARMLAERWRGDPAVLGWDLTDEPPYWIIAGTTDAEARGWTTDLVTALRGEDPEHLITIGTASQEVRGGPFRADVVADLLDFTCVHPYPIYSPDLFPDGLLDPRMTHSAAFETALTAGAGRPVMLQEFGASSTQYHPERIAAYDRLFLWSSFGRGAIGFLSWCWSDAEPEAYRRVPYVRWPHETQFGFTDASGEVRPRGRVLAEFAEAIRSVDLDGYAGRGPDPRAGIVVPYEYVHPYDRRFFGLDEKSGIYTPAEPVWNPDPGVVPLVHGWLNAFVLAARAGIAVSFPRECPEDDHWPELRLLLLPAPLTTTSTTLWHVRTTFWRGTPAFHAAGGTVYLSLSADSAIPEMTELAGCRILDREPADPAVRMTFVEPWGPFAPDDTIEIPAADDNPSTRGVLLDVVDARTVAVDEHGHPALVVADRANGHTVTCAFPIELLLARIPDAHRRHADWYGLYTGLAELSNAREDAWADHPDVTSGVLLGDRGGLVALTNHSPAQVEFDLVLPSGAIARETLPPRTAGPRGKVRLNAYDTAVVTWDHPSS